MNGLSVVFRCDGSPRVGLGHVMRCIAIAQAARARGARTSFVVRESGVADALAARYGFPAAILPRRTPEPTALARLASGADWIVADGYDFDERWWAAVRRPGLRVCAVVDHKAPPEVDLVVNPNLHARAVVRRPADRLSGARFALLREEFVAARRRRRVPARRLRLLVMFGGSDVAGLTARTLRYLAELPDLPPLAVTAVVGPAARGRGAIGAAAAAVPHPTRVVVAPRNVAQVMAGADLAVTAAGSSVLELLCLGVPPLMTTVADNQAGIAVAAASAGAGLDLGPAHAFSRERLREALVHGFHERRSLAAAGRRLVDGRGAARVARALETLSDGRRRR